MSSLEVLLLDNNILVGTIPPQLAQLGKLRRLNLAAQGEQQARAQLVTLCTEHSSTVSTLQHSALKHPSSAVAAQGEAAVSRAQCSSSFQAVLLLGC
jgi:hypothetical protein